MAKALGKVTGDLNAPRGPDVEHRIFVKHDWFGSLVSICLPRNLNCAACKGGGCDRCARSGAVSLRERHADAEQVRVVLPPLDGVEGELCLRLPGQGGLSTTEGEGRGHLLLRVVASDEPSEGVLVGRSRKVFRRSREASFGKA